MAARFEETRRGCSEKRNRATDVRLLEGGCTIEKTPVPTPSSSESKLYIFCPDLLQNSENRLRDPASWLPLAARALRQPFCSFFFSCLCSLKIACGSAKEACSHILSPSKKGSELLFCSHSAHRYLRIFYEITLVHIFPSLYYSLSV